MSELDGLSGKPMTRDIGGVSITLKPLTLKDLATVLKAASDKEDIRTQGVTELIDKTLRQSYPTETDPLSKISLAHISDLIKFVLEVNGMPGETTPLGRGEAKKP